LTIISNQKVVILITIDCLRKDHLKSYGYCRNIAPNQEIFIRKGVTFLSTIANGPETTSSFSSIFSSVLPYLNGGFSPLPNQKLTFPQILNENYIYCYGIHSNPNLGKLFNYHKGFNDFIEGENFNVQLDENKNKNGSVASLINQQFFKNYRSRIFNEVFLRLIRFKFFEIISNKFMNLNFIRDKITQANRGGFIASFLVKKVINFLKSYNFSRPLFIWVHFMDVHWPYNPPLKNLFKFTNKYINSKEKEFLLNKVFWNPKDYINSERLNDLIKLYNGEMNFIDDNLAKLFKFLEKRFKKNCLVIITSDHGEGFYEHEFLNHGGYVYDELLKVPLFIVEIGKNHALKKVQEPVQLTDIAPTILEYFNIDVPDFFQGKSLFSLMKGESLTRKQYIISESYRKNGRFIREREKGFKIFSIRKQTWKYIFNEEEKMEYLFNLLEDPDEKINLISKNPEIINEFREIRNKHFQEITKSEEMSKITHAIKDVDFKTIKM
jgi:arylsulfatase A-like enzyme